MEGVLECAQFVEHAAERPDVALESVRLVLAHLRTHVVGRADHSHRSAVRVLKHFRYPEIAQFHRVVARQEYVLSFEVTVHHLATVDVLERQTELHKPVEDLCLREYLILS